MLSRLPRPDAERRDDLRTFLAERRSRLQPADVGLPVTSRRRVPGLRREEVAELVGVSSDWYRWLESGRPVRVSPQFVARLSRALQLDAFEERALYHLALPEIYEVDNALHPRFDGPSLLSPIESLNDIEPAGRTFASARDVFLSGAPAPSSVRARIANSWERSRMLGADPMLPGVPACIACDDDLASLRRASEMLLQAAEPICVRLESVLLDLGYAIVTTNATGCILAMGGEKEILRRLARIDFEPGGDLSEAACGTNAVGTAIFDGRPLQVMGAENFTGPGSDLTCTAAPIRDPSTHEIIGALDLTADYRRIRPELVTYLTRCILEIEERLGSTPARG